MKTILGAAALLLASTGAQAVTIDGLYNSGVNSGGANTGAGGGATTGNGPDSHWTLIGGTAYNGGTNGQFPIGPWLEETATSRWLTPTPNAGDSLDPNVPGTYTFRQTFNVVRGVGSSLTGRLASDNAAVLLLNGVQIGTASGFSAFEDFSATTGFVNGLNTLDIVLTNGAQNGGNPAGARIEFASSVGAVPEPAAWAMMIAGFGLLGAASRRRRTMSVTFA